MTPQQTRNLNPVTWDQAAIAHLATTGGLARLLNLHPVTIRRWASHGRITPVGKAPNGAHLYSIRAVTRHASRRGK